MNIWYKQLLEVNVGHDYFNDDRCPDFEFFPTENTLRLLRNVGLVMKPAADGFKVFCKLDVQLSTNTDFIAAHRFDQPFKLVFGMRLKNSQFPQYTNLPDSKAARQVFYLGNRVNVAGSTPSNLLLGEAQSAGGQVSANDLVFLAGDNYRWSFSAASVADPAIQITWTDLAGNIVRQETFAKNDQDQVQALFEQLSDIPDALYLVSTAPNVPEGNRRVVKQPAMADNPPFGVVEIWSHPVEVQNRFHDDVVLVVNGQPTPATRINAKTYFVRFQRRSLPWRYQLVRNTPTLNLAAWSVQFGAVQNPYPAGVVFTGSPADATTTQREFVSNVPLPFFQTPKKDVQLSAAGLQPLSNIPNPDPRNIKQDNSGNLYAESIIYI